VTFFFVSQAYKSTCVHMSEPPFRMCKHIFILWSKLKHALCRHMRLHIYIHTCIHTYSVVHIHTYVYTYIQITSARNVCVYSSHVSTHILTGHACRVIRTKNYTYICILYVYTCKKFIAYETYIQPSDLHTNGACSLKIQK
jgi:hypothetical protein